MATTSENSPTEQLTSASVIVEQTTTFSPEPPGHYVFTITTTVDVNGAMQNDTLRENIFSTLETDLLIPALAKVPQYETVSIDVRTLVQSVRVMLLRTL